MKTLMIDLKVIKMIKKKQCLTCNKKLNENNKSGYCLLCYRKSPKYLEYQRLYQKVIFHSQKNKETKKRYYEKHKDEIKEYQKKYHKEHKDKIRKQKAESQRKRRREGK